MDQVNKHIKTTIKDIWLPLQCIVLSVYDVDVTVVTIIRLNAHASALMSPSQHVTGDYATDVWSKQSLAWPNDVTYFDSTFYLSKVTPDLTLSKVSACDVTYLDGRCYVDGRSKQSLTLPDDVTYLDVRSTQSLAWRCYVLRLSI